MGYVISGMFYQVRAGLGIGFSTAGAAAVVGEGIVGVRFGGSFREKDDGSGVLSGIMCDRVGDSLLADIVLTDCKLSFTKHYVNRDDGIRYHFTKQADETWVGEWEGSACGRGFAKCMIFPVPDVFFEPLILSGEQCSECGSLLGDDPGDIYRI